MPRLLLPPGLPKSDRERWHFRSSGVSISSDLTQQSSEGLGVPLSLGPGTLSPTGEGLGTIVCIVLGVASQDPP